MPPTSQPAPAALPAVQTPAAPSWPARLLRRAARAAGRLILAGIKRLLRRLARRLWRHRDLHVIWWAALALYLTAVPLYLLGAAWWAVGWIVGILGAALTAALYQRLGENNLLPLDRRTTTAAAAVAAAWITAATAAGPATTPVALAWAIASVAASTGWAAPRAARAWRRLRIRTRHWAAALPIVLADLNAAGVALADRPAVHPGGRVDFPLRLPTGVTRAKLDKLRVDIEVGMHWAEHSIREITQDPGHTSAARVILSWSEGKIQARTVKFAPPQIPTSIYEAAWVGVNDDGHDVFVINYAPGQGMTRGLYGGESGAAKSGLLRLIAYMRAHCPDVLIWCIDLKNNGLTYAHLMARLDRPIATTREAAARILADAAAAIPLRGRLLTADDNQLLPLSPKRPAILVIGDEISTLLGKTPANAAAISSAKEIGGKGRALGIGMEAASQYFSQDSFHPSLLPLFNRRYAGRVAAPADIQHLIRGWNRLTPTVLPTGVFYAQRSGSNATELIYTPEMTDKMLAQAAADTAHLTPALEAPTAEALPHYSDRWDDMPDHLMPYATEEQRQQVYATRARLKSARQRATTPATAGRAAAADSRPPRRLVVVEHLDEPSQTAPAAGRALTLADITDAPLRAMTARHLSSPIVSTAESNTSAEPRVRQWATDRRTAWERRGIIERDGRGKWRTLAGESAMVAGVLAAEGDIRAGRGGGGEEPSTAPRTPPP